MFYGICSLYKCQLVALNKREKYDGARALYEQHMYVINTLENILPLGLIPYILKDFSENLDNTCKSVCDVVVGTDLKFDSQRA